MLDLKTHISLCEKESESHVLLCKEYESFR